MDDFSQFGQLADSYLGLGSQQQDVTQQPSIATPQPDISAQSISTMSGHWDDFITEESKKYPNIPESVVRSLIKVESSGNPMADVEAKPGVWVRGLGQFKDNTAKDFIPDWKDPSDSYIPEKNIQGIYAYLDYLTKRHGSLARALELYLGTGKADKFGTTPRQHSNNILSGSKEHISFKEKEEDFSAFAQNADVFFGTEQAPPVDGEPTKRPIGATGTWEAEGTPTSALKAIYSSSASITANMINATKLLFTPSETKTPVVKSMPDIDVADELSKKARNKIESLAMKINDSVDDKWKKEVEGVSGRSISIKALKEDPAAWLNTVATFAAQQVPVYVSQIIGTTVGTIAGGIPGGIIGGATPMILSETGSFMEAGANLAKQMNLTPEQTEEWNDLLNEYSFQYGIASGTIEYVGNAFGALGGVGLSAAGLKKAKQEALKGSMKLIGLVGRGVGLLGEGAEEVSQQRLQEILMFDAVKRLKSSFPGQIKIELAKPTSLLDPTLSDAEKDIAIKSIMSAGIFSGGITAAGNVQEAVTGDQKTAKTQAAFQLRGIQEDQQQIKQDVGVAPFAGFGTVEQFVENMKDMSGVNREVYMASLTPQERAEATQRLGDTITMGETVPAQEEAPKQPAEQPIEQERTVEQTVESKLKAKPILKEEAAKEGTKKIVTPIQVGDMFTFDDKRYRLQEIAAGGQVVTTKSEIDENGEEQIITEAWPTLEKFAKDTGVTPVNARGDVIKTPKQKQKVTIKGKATVAPVPSKAEIEVQETIQQQEEAKQKLEKQVKVEPVVTEKPVEAPKKKSKFEDYTDEEIVDYLKTTKRVRNTDLLSEESIAKIRNQLVEKGETAIPKMTVGRETAAVGEETRSRDKIEAQVEILEEVSSAGILEYNPQKHDALIRSGKLEQIPQTNHVGVTDAGTKYMDENRAGISGRTVAFEDQIANVENAVAIREQDEQDKDGNTRRIAEIDDDDVSGERHAKTEEVTIISPTRQQEEHGRKLASSLGLKYNGVNEGLAEGNKILHEPIILMTMKDLKTTIAAPVSATVQDVQRILEKTRAKFAVAQPVTTQQPQTYGEKLFKNLMKNFKPSAHQYVQLHMVDSVMRTNKKTGAVTETRLGYERGSSLGMIQFTKDGGAHVYISPKLGDVQTFKTMIHELILHFGAYKVLSGNKALYQRAYDLQQTDTEGSSRVTQHYGKQISEMLSPSAAEQLIFDEWLAYRGTQIADRLFDADGNLKPQKKDNILTKLYDIIKDYINNTFRGRVSDKQIEKLVREVCNSLKDIDVSKTHEDKIRHAIVGNLEQVMKVPKRTDVNSRSLIKKAKTANEQRIRIAEFVNTKLKDADLKLEVLEAAADIREAGDKAFQKAYEMLDPAFDKSDKRQAARRLKATISKIDWKNVSPELKEKLHNLVGDIDPTLMTEAKRKKLEEAQAIADKEDTRLVSDKVLDELARLNKTNVKDMDVADIRDMANEVKALLFEAKKERDYLTQDKYKKRDEASDAADEQIKKYAVVRNSGAFSKIYEKMFGLSPKTIEQQSQDWTANLGISGVAQKIRDIYRIWSEMKASTELVVNELDLLDADGIFSTMIYNNINKGYRTEEEYRNDSANELGKVNDVADVSLWSEYFYSKLQRLYTSLPHMKQRRLQKISVKLSGDREITMTPAQRMAVYLHSLSRDNLRHIVDPKGGFEINKKIVKMSIEDVDAIVSSMTDKEHNVADILYNFLNTFQRDAINKVANKYTGHDEAIVDNYFPINVSRLGLRLFDKAGINMNTMRDMMRMTTPGSKLVKERTGKAVQPIVLEDAFEAIARVNTLAGKYIGLAAPVTEGRAFLEDVKATMVDKGLEPEAKNIQMFLDRTAGDLKFDDVGNAFMRAMFRNYTIGNLALSIYSALKQPVSYLASWTVRDHLVIEGKPSMKDVNNALEEIQKWSPELRSRLHGLISVEVGEVVSEKNIEKLFKVQKKSVGENIIGNFIRYIMAPLTVTDATAITQIWRDSRKYAKLYKKFDNETDKMKWIADDAERVVRVTQPTYSPKDRAPIQQSLLLRPFFMFYSQISKDYMMLRRARMKMLTGNTKGALWDFFILGTVQPALIASINSLRRQMTWDEEDKDKESEWNRFFKDWVMTMIVRAPIISNVVSMFIDQYYDSMTIPFQESAKTLVRLMKRVQDSITGDTKIRSYKEQQKSNESLQRDLIKFAADNGIPARGIEQLFNTGKNIAEKLED